jgi:hypothetical protein
MLGIRARVHRSLPTRFRTKTTIKNFDRRFERRFEQKHRLGESRIFISERYEIIERSEDISQTKTSAQLN